MSPDLPPIGNVAVDDSSTPILSPPTRGIEDDLIESSPTPEVNYTPPSSPPVPVEDHEIGRETGSPSLPTEVHERAEVEGMNALDIFRASMREYSDRIGADDRGLDPPVIATENKLRSPTLPAGVKECDTPEVEMLEIGTKYQQEQELEVSEQGGEPSEIAHSPSDQPANSQDVLQDGISEVPKTPPQRGTKSGGVPTASSGFLTPERQSRGPDLFAGTPQLPQSLREEHTIEVPGTTDNIKNTPSPKPTPTVLNFTGLSRRTLSPDGPSISRILDSHTKPATRGVTFADSVAAEESESECQNELTSAGKSPDSQDPFHPLKRKRKRAPLFSPRKARKIKQGVEEEDGPMGDCIIVLPSPQNSPPLPKSAARKTFGRKTKNTTKGLAPSDHSDEGLTRMLSISHDKRTLLIHLIGSRKRLASVLDDSVEIPTNHKKSK
jgi:hypothetical protein